MRDRRRVLAVLWVLALAPRVVLAVSQPVWARVDEAFHADYVAQLAAGRYPREGITRISPEIQLVMQETGVYRWDPYGQPEPDPAAWTSGAPAGMDAHARVVWMRRNLWRYSYEAFQPPTYYLLMVPLWKAAELAGGTWTAIYALRLVNAALGALIAPLAFVIGDRLWPRSAGPATFAAAVAAFLPGQVVNGSAITNDTLAAVAATASLAVAATLAGKRVRAGAAVLIGLLLGGAIAVKPTAAGVAPAVLTALLWDPLTRREIGRALRTVCLVAAPAVLAILPWIAVNLVIYGSPTTAAAAAALNTVEADGAAAGTVATDMLFGYATFWLGEPTTVTVAATPAALGLFVYLAPIFALVGLVHARGRVSPSVAAALGAAALGEIALMLVSPVLVSSGFLPPGRYLYPAAAAIAALIAVGLWLEVPRPRARLVAAAAWATVLAAVVVAEVHGAGPVVRTPAGAPADGTARATVASAQADGLEVLVDEISDVPGSRYSWVHVIERNGGTTAADVSQVPDVVVTDAVVGHGDYAAGTHLPETLGPGGEVAGWLRLDVPGSKLRSLGTFQLVFRDTATSDYAHVADLALTVDA